MQDKGTRPTPIDEELIRIAKKRNNGRPLFRCRNITAETAFQLLRQCYINEVERRGAQCSLNNPLLQHIRDVAELMTGDSHKFGVLMTGRVGNGKTTLMRAINEAIKILVDVRLIDPYEEFRSVSRDVCLKIRTAKEIVYMDEKDYGEILDAPLVGIDELGEEPREVMEYGNVSTPVIDILEHRYTRQLFTVVTTNLDPAEITQRYGERIGDRMREMFGVVVFGDHESFRR